MPATTKIKKLPASAVGYPRFKPGKARECTPFSLSSHERARDALEFGLALDEPGFNIFILGDERSGRMTSTLDFLESYVADKPVPDDWVYLNNFRHANQPIPFRLPAGQGRNFHKDMAQLITKLQSALKETFQRQDIQTQIKAKSDEAQSSIAQQFAAIQEEAQANGLELGCDPNGQISIMRKSNQDSDGQQQEPNEADQHIAAIGQKLSEKMALIAKEASEQQISLAAWINEFSRNLGDQVITPYLDTLSKTYGEFAGFARWLTALRTDFLDHLQLFFAETPNEGGDAKTTASHDTPERRYAVNLFVEQDEDGQSSVILEANPTYENLFGRIEYEQIDGHLHTDYRMLQAGSLHHANGGILVLRAEAIAADQHLWTHLKGALRDREIRIEEIHRADNVPVAGAPQPRPIPLDVKVIIVGAPQWYYSFFSGDPDFQTYFKVKADIDSDMVATPANVACYAALIKKIASDYGDVRIKFDALSLLLGEAARIAGHREKLSARFEDIADIVRESLPADLGPSRHTLSRDAVANTLDNKRLRNSRIEDRIQETISGGLVAITTSGTATGQINALTVRDQGDYSFGAPARITARASVGRRGAINIERDVALGGPIQQKGMMVLQGYLAGRFAQTMPVSFDCSVTFEQSYGGVEGDSASMAELLAILSDLADAPLRQDLAITGSVDQFGKAQAIGGATQKIEGFFRTCIDQGGLNGTQGVIVPASNVSQIVLRKEIADAVSAKKFHIYAMQSVEQAAQLFTGISAKSLFERVVVQLEKYDQILADRS